MRKLLTIIFLLSATAVVVSLNGKAWLAGMKESATISALNTEQSLVQKAPLPCAAIISGDGSATPILSQINIAPTSPTMPDLSSDENALVAEMCDLQLLSYNSPLTLSSRQWSAFAGLVLRIQVIRQTFEAQIATAKVISPGLYRVEIPVYASAGDALRQNFYTGLQAELGVSTAADILTKIGDRLEGRFAGFGVSAQTLDISGNPDAALSEVQVTRTVTYWNSVEGSDRLTTRHETHFPAWEDPTGDSWSELLAMVKT